MEINEMQHSDIVKRLSEIKNLLDTEDVDIDVLTAEVDALEARDKELAENAEKEIAFRQRVAAGIEPVAVIETHDLKGDKTMNVNEERAKKFAETGHLEIRTLVSTGQIAKPTVVGGIEGLADQLGSIVDDVFAVEVSGNGAYRVSYKKKNATAVKGVEGKAPTNAETEFDFVDINPEEWTTLSTVSKLVAKTTPLNYTNAVEESAIVALREKAEKMIIDAVLGSALLEKKTNIALDAQFLRKIALSFKAVKGKGSTKLYLTRNDLIKLGDIRGKNENKPVYDVKANEDGVTGTITDGALTVAYSVTDQLTDGTQLYGQPKTIHMPMWGDYEINTDEGGQYFANRVVAILGTQLAGAGLATVGGMVSITNAA